MSEIIYWIQLNAENLFEFGMESIQFVLIAILIYRDWSKNG